MYRKSGSKFILATSDKGKSDLMIMRSQRMKVKTSQILQFVVFIMELMLHLQFIKNEDIITIWKAPLLAGICS